MSLLPISEPDASAVVLTFDDLPDRYILSGSSYAGITWEVGNVGLGPVPGVWAAVVADHPHSAPVALVNTGGATLIGIGFPSPVDVSGAYFAVQGNVGAWWATSVRVHGFSNGEEVSTPWLTPISSNTAWLDMSLLRNVDRILIESVPGSQDNAGAYALDDLTFTYIPEPASLSLLGLGGVMLRRRHRA
jgi:hypothetical protein